MRLDIRKRWEYARRTKLGWREIVGPLLTGLLFWLASERYGWDEPVSPIIGGAVVAVLGVLLIYVVEFALKLLFAPMFLRPGPWLPTFVRYHRGVLLSVLVAALSFGSGVAWTMWLQGASDRADSTADSTIVSAPVPVRPEADSPPPSPARPATNTQASVPAPRPRPVAVLSAEPNSAITETGEEFSMVVRNTGRMRVERVWATITVSRRDVGGSTPKAFLGYWEAAQGANADLAPGQWDRLRLGAITRWPDTSQITYTVKYYKDGVRDSMVVPWGLVGGQPVSHGVQLDLEVTVESYPPMRPPRLTRTFLIHHLGWEAIAVDP